MSTPAQANRRASPRRKPRGGVKLECRKGALGLGANVASQCLDVSEGGARIIVKVPLTVKDEVEVIMLGFGVPAVKRLANVRWVEPLADGQWCVGLRFQKYLAYRDVQSLARP
jgi:hypothetical protein